MFYLKIKFFVVFFFFNFIMEFMYLLLMAPELDAHPGRLDTSPHAGRKSAKRPRVSSTVLRFI